MVGASLVVSSCLGLLYCLEFHSITLPYLLMMSQVAGLVVELRSRVSNHLRIREPIYSGYVSLSLGQESIRSTFSLGDLVLSE